jgi:relaxase-like protein
MIAVSSSSRSFAALGRYLVVGRDKVEEGRVAWTSARNLPTDEPELAAKIMRATASQNVRVSQPVYHIALSFDPGDAVDRKSMEHVADRVLKELKLDQYQAIIVAHADRAHPHLHILVNRIHPETGRAWDRWQDYPAIQRVLREEESQLNLRPVRASVDVSPNVARAVESPSAVAQREDGMTTTTSRSRVSSIEKQFDELDRAKAATEQRFAAEREVAAAESRRAQIETAIAREEKARTPFESALRRACVEPRAAAEAFLQCAEREGERVAVAKMREQPESFGRLIATRESSLWRRDILDHSSAREAAKEAAGHGANLIAARRDLKNLTSPERHDGSFARSEPTADNVRERSNAELDAARSRLNALRSSHGGTASLERIEWRLGQALRRLAPPEFERLRSTLSAERFSIAGKLRRMARDAVLGRDADE